MEDPEIVKAVLEGDTEAYAEIVRRHSARLLGLCTMFLNHRAQAEEALQDVLIKAYQALRTYRGDSPFRFWIDRIAAHHCTDLIRSRKRHPTESWEDLAERQKEDPEAPMQEPGNAHRQLESSEFITELLSHLPFEYRQVIVLREIEGYSYNEIAATLECSLDSVKARLRRARAQLESRRRQIEKRRNNEA